MAQVPTLEGVEVSLAPANYLVENGGETGGDAFERKTGYLYQKKGGMVNGLAETMTSIVRMM